MVFACIWFTVVLSWDGRWAGRGMHSSKYIQSIHGGSQNIHTDTHSYIKQSIKQSIMAHNPSIQTHIHPSLPTNLRVAHRDEHLPPQDDPDDGAVRGVELQQVLAEPAGLLFLGGWGSGFSRSTVGRATYSYRYAYIHIIPLEIFEPTQPIPRNKTPRSPTPPH